MAGPIRVGIVGARFAAGFHLARYRRVYGGPVEVVGVTSKSQESGEAFASQHGIKAFASIEELCEAADVVDICTPGSAHEPVAIAALERGKHVVVERPFTGFSGPTDGTDFRGNVLPKETMRREARASCDRSFRISWKAARLTVNRFPAGRSPAILSPSFTPLASPPSVAGPRWR